MTAKQPILVTFISQNGVTESYGADEIRAMGREKFFALVDAHQAEGRRMIALRTKAA